MPVRSASPSLLAALLALGGASAFAQAAPATAAPAASSAAVVPVEAAPQPASKTKDAKIEHLVTEDSQVRIEEVRVRGVSKQIVVHSKIPGMGSYEIRGLTDREDLDRLLVGDTHPVAVLELDDQLHQVE